MAVSINSNSLFISIPILFFSLPIPPFYYYYCNQILRDGKAKAERLSAMRLKLLFLLLLLLPFQVLHSQFPRTSLLSKRRRRRRRGGLRPRFDFLPWLGMRAHLRQIVNTFIHVRQPRVLYSVVAPVLDNETGAFCPFPFAPPHLG